MKTTAQPDLLNFHAASSENAVAEAVKEIWPSLEAVCAPSPAIRREGLQQLESIVSPPESLLLVSQLSSLLRDPEIDIRCRALRLLVGIASGAKTTLEREHEIRQVVAGCLARASLGDVAMLLACGAEEDANRAALGRLFNLYAPISTLLAELAASRSQPVALRQEAIFFLGNLGFADAAPVLRKLAERLAARQRGQGVMPFAPPVDNGEAPLLPLLKKALAQLEGL